MNIEKFKEILFDAFTQKNEDKFDSIVTGAFIDASLMPKKIDLNKIKLKQPFSLHFEFIAENFIDGQFVEPYSHWIDVPEWYIEAFSFYGLGQTSQKKVLFYLPKVMLLELEGGFFNDSTSSETWCFAMCPNLDYYEKKYKDYHFYKFLTEKQKSIISFYLSYDVCDGVFDTSNIIEDSDFYLKYWKPYLNNF